MYKLNVRRNCGNPWKVWFLGASLVIAMASYAGYPRVQVHSTNLVQVRRYSVVANFDGEIAGHDTITGCHIPAAEMTMKSQKME